MDVDWERKCHRSKALRLDLLPHVGFVDAAALQFPVENRVGEVVEKWGLAKGTAPLHELGARTRTRTRTKTRTRMRTRAKDEEDDEDKEMTRTRTRRRTRI